MLMQAILFFPALCSLAVIFKYINIFIFEINLKINHFAWLLRVCFPFLVLLRWFHICGYLPSPRWYSLCLPTKGWPGWVDRVAGNMPRRSPIGGLDVEWFRWSYRRDQRAGRPATPFNRRRVIDGTHVRNQWNRRHAAAGDKLLLSRSGDESMHPTSHNGRSRQISLRKQSAATVRLWRPVSGADKTCHVRSSVSINPQSHAHTRTRTAHAAGRRSLLNSCNGTAGRSRS